MIRPLLFFLLLAVPHIHAEWRILHLDDRTLVLTGDCSAQLQDVCRNRKSAISGNRVPKWEKELRRDLEPARVILEKRPALVRSLRDNPQISLTSAAAPVKVVRTGFWMNPTGLLRIDGLPTRNAEVAYHLFLQFDRPLSNGEKLKIHLPGGETLAYTHAPDIAVSALFKWNQAGYPLEAGRRYAYLGAWLGTVGPMPLKQYAGKPFELIQADTGKTVFRGTLAARRYPRSLYGAFPPHHYDHVCGVDGYAAHRAGLGQGGRRKPHSVGRRCRRRACLLADCNPLHNARNLPVARRIPAQGARQDSVLRQRRRLQPIGIF